MDNRNFSSNTYKTEVVSSDKFNIHASDSRLSFDNFKSFFHNTIFLRIFIGVLVTSILGFVIYVFLSGGFTQAGSYEPTNVAIKSVTEGSAVITWETAVETQGVIEYGTTPTSLNFFAPETEAKKKHEVELTLLSPGTTYYFQIRINDKVYDNGGVPWTFTTKEKSDSKVTPVPSVNDDSLSNSSDENIDTKPTPTPYEKFEINNSNIKKECNYDSCEKIKVNLGNGCSVKDYLLCKSKNNQNENLNSTPTPTPTLTPTQTPTPTSTPTPTPTPTLEITPTSEPTSTPTPTPTTTI